MLICKSLFKLIEEETMSLKTEKRKVLTANNFRFDVRLSGKSLMYVRKVADQE